MGISRRRANARLEFLQRRATAMRRKPSPPEKAMVSLLELVTHEIKWVWRTQHVSEHEGFILDFYEPKARICLEVDGQQHYRNRKQLDKDVLRDSILEGENIEVIRIPAYRLREDSMGVLEQIYRRYVDRIAHGNQRRPSRAMKPEERDAIRMHNLSPHERINQADIFAPFKRSKKPF